MGVAVIVAALRGNVSLAGPGSLPAIDFLGAQKLDRCDQRWLAGSYGWIGLVTHPLGVFRDCLAFEGFTAT